MRAALPHLSDYSSKFYGFVSLACPHLGYMNAKSNIVSAGLWILKKWKRSISMSQLKCDDAKNLNDCALYKLSEMEGLGWFKFIALC